MIPAKFVRENSLNPKLAANMFIYLLKTHVCVLIIWKEAKGEKVGDVNGGQS